MSSIALPNVDWVNQDKGYRVGMVQSAINNLPSALRSEISIIVPIVRMYADENSLSIFDRHVLVYSIQHLTKRMVKFNNFQQIALIYFGNDDKPPNTESVEKYEKYLNDIRNLCEGKIDILPYYESAFWKSKENTKENCDVCASELLMCIHCTKNCNCDPREYYRKCIYCLLEGEIKLDIWIDPETNPNTIYESVMNEAVIFLNKGIEDGREHRTLPNFNCEIKACEMLYKNGYELGKSRR